MMVNLIQLIFLQNFAKIKVCISQFRLKIFPIFQSIKNNFTRFDNCIYFNIKINKKIINKYKYFY